MPGMNSGVNINDPTVVAAFKAALLHQGLIALLIFGLLGVAWVLVRAWPSAPTRTGAVSAASPASAGSPAPAESPAPAHDAMAASSARAAGSGTPPAGATQTPAASAHATAEPTWRQLLRIGFGLIWIFDGILQAQPKMAIGLPSQVIEPTAASSPRWVQHVVNWAGTNWSYHPMQAGASAVWIQVGIGIWLLVAARGPWSRLAGLVSVGWGLVVWVFGESFGGIFAPGLTWLFGAPGAVLIYAVAGALIALPERTWYSPRVGRLTLGGLGLFLCGMAVLQAWPGRGFWQGTSHGQAGTLTGMVQSMAGTPQPHFLSAWVTWFGNLTAAHGFVVNMVVVVALAAIGLAFLTGRPQLIRPALIAFTVLCLLDWVFIEDLGFLGGLGTDPNSMVPFILLAVAGYLALTRVPEAPGQTAGSPMPWRDRVRLASLRRSVAGASFQSVAAVGAIGVIILGAAPMAAAQANPVADTILAQSIDGNSAPLNFPAPAFSLTDQHGRTVTLASLRGKVVLLTFLDDTCTSDCPLIAQEFRDAGQLLAASRRHVELVAIDYNPLYTHVSYLQAFDRQEGLATVPNWLYLTGTLAQLKQAWHRYGVPPAEVLPAGSMIGHGDYAFVLDQHGHMREELSFDPGPGTQATMSSFAAELTDDANQLLGHS
jgi:cytochrome oxidase Cu insertion factor (SCO1/SenC/PrrC family)